MSKQIALLRAINVGGNNKIPMAELRKLFEKSGMTQVRSLLQTGNLVFQSREKGSAALCKKLATATEKEFGVAVDYIIRTAKEWEEVIAQNPFPKEAIDDPSHLVVMFLRDAPTADQVKALRSAIKGREVIEAKGNHLYMVYPDGIGDSKLTIAIVERHLATRGTGRNWNTVLKLGAMCKE